METENGNEQIFRGMFEKTKEMYHSKIEPVFSTLIQFVLWYLGFHTLYWSVEQLRFTWCVPCGLTGYLHSLVASQSLVCRFLTSASKTMADQQLSTITMLSSFIGAKIVGSQILGSKIEPSKTPQTPEKSD